MRRFARINNLAGPRLLGTARGRSVVMDRPNDAGDDIGFMSGELLLLALGSCVAGGLKRYSKNINKLNDDFWVELELLPKKDGDDLSPIAIVLGVERPKDPEQAQILIDTALSGDVSGRLKKCGAVDVQFMS
jgi:hypothetical protein